jgi:uncharacterized protein YbbC (DUF1343 family)
LKRLAFKGGFTTFKNMVTLALSHFEKSFPVVLRGKRLGAVLHPASVCADLSYTLVMLKDWDGKLFKLSALFGPLHGIKGHTQHNRIEWEG